MRKTVFLNHLFTKFVNLFSVSCTIIDSYCCALSTDIFSLSRYPTYTTRNMCVYRCTRPAPLFVCLFSLCFLFVIVRNLHVLAVCVSLPYAIPCNELDDVILLVAAVITNKCLVLSKDDLIWKWLIGRFMTIDSSTLIWDISLWIPEFNNNWKAWLKMQILIKTF